MNAQSRHRSGVAAVLAMLLISGSALAQASDPPANPPSGQPADPMDHRPPPPDHKPGDRDAKRPPPDGPDRMPETFDRETVKKRLENRLKELTASQERLTKALEKLESGAPLTDVWGELGPAPGSGRFNGPGPAAPSGNFGERLKERLKPGKDGRPGEMKGEGKADRPPERGDRPRHEGKNDMADASGAVFNLPPGAGEPLNPEEREKLFRYLQDNMPRVADRFHQWQKLDPDGFDIFLDRMAPRVREAGAILKRDPDGAKLRMAEVEKGLDVLDATQSMRTLYAAEQPDQAKLTETRAKLKESLGAQMDARFAVHQHQITMLEHQIQDLRKQAEEMSAKKAERLDERAAAFEAGIKERAGKHDSKPEPKPK